MFIQRSGHHQNLKGRCHTFPTLPSADLKCKKKGIDSYLSVQNVNIMHYLINYTVNHGTVQLLLTVGMFFLKSHNVQSSDAKKLDVVKFLYFGNFDSNDMLSVVIILMQLEAVTHMSHSQGL